MPEQGIGLLPNPNVCATCSMIVDPMEDATELSQGDPEQAQHLEAEPTEQLRRAA
jgi:hypothetical protein